MPVIAVFGSFDGLHKGHEHLLQEARTHGDVLVLLAQDDTIRRLKKREPYHEFAQRLETLRMHPYVTQVRGADVQEGEYLCLQEERPDVVGFGYDQDALFNHFLAWKEKSGYTCTVVRFSPFEPEVYKASLLNSVMPGYALP